MPGEVDPATLPIFTLAILASGVSTLIPDAVLRRVGEVVDGLEPDHRARALHRVHVAKHVAQQIRIAGPPLDLDELARERVEPLGRLVEEQLDHVVVDGGKPRMMSAGEQTGKIDSMLERIADFLDEEIETTLSGLTSLIEPLLIVFLGVVVGGIVICMFLPIFKMSEIINPPSR